jgi:HKD family nuclease
MKVIANRNNTAENDRFGFNLKKAAKGRHLDIAVAFFTDFKSVQELLENGSDIRMIVRLNIGTSLNSLRQIIGKSNIKIRYFTSTRFHPKLYIVNHDSAFVGSSNFTQSAQSRNNEINICFDYEEDENTFSELSTIFDNYWEEAQVLDQKALKIFEEKLKEYNATTYISDLYGERDGTYPNNTTTYEKKNNRRLYIENFKRNYQDYIENFNKLTDYYNMIPKRKWNDIPLRIEIDRFLWWIRDYKCSGPDGWRRGNILNDKEIKDLVFECKVEYLDFQSEYLDKIAYNYKIVEKGFSSRESIESMDEDTIFDTLNNVHAFNELLRFHRGGTEGLKRDFFKFNTLVQIKKSLMYLIYGANVYEDRVYDCIYSQEYKLQAFGKSCVKELYGYINKDEIPICNGRTLKSLEWLGFGKL